MFRRDESSMHYASAGVIIINAVSWLVLVAGLVLLIFKYWIPASLVLLVVAVWYVFSEKYYNYYNGVCIEFNRKGFKYSYKLNSDVLSSSNCKVEITCSNMTKLRIKGRKAVVYGHIIKLSPFKKPKELKKVEICVDFGVDKDSVISELKNRLIER